jgi:hypothetical protein
MVFSIQQWVITFVDDLYQVDGVLDSVMAVKSEHLRHNIRFQFSHCELSIYM